MRKISEFYKKAFQDLGLQSQMQGQQPGQDPESLFQDQIKGIFMQYTQTKFPWLRPDSSINIIKTDVDSNTVTASIDLEINGNIIRIPILYVNGEIVEPFSIFIEGENRFFPLSESWYNRIISSFENETGDLLPRNDQPYRRSLHDRDKVIDSTDMSSGYNVRYAALEKLDLDEILPLVKKAMVNGYIYDHYGKELVQVASKKLLRKKASKKSNKIKSYNLNEGYFIIDQDSFKKVSGLSLSDRIDIFNKLQTESWVGVDKRRKTAEIKIVEYKADNPENFLDMSILPQYTSKLIGSYDKKTGERIYYIPKSSRVEDPFSYKESDSEMIDRLRRKYREKAIMTNSTAVEDINKLLEDVKGDIPGFLKSIIDKDIKAVKSSPETNVNQSSEHFMIIPLDSDKKFSVNIYNSDDYDYLKSKLDIINISRHEGKYLVDERGNKYIVVNMNNVIEFFTEDFENFVERAVDLTDYVSGKLTIKKNYHGDKFTLTAERKGKEAKLSYLDKKTAAFILGNIFKIPCPEDVLSSKSQSVQKYAMNIDPSIIGKIESLANDLKQMAEPLSSPDQQKKVLDKHSGSKNGITINIENLNYGSGDKGGIEAAMPQEEQGSVVTEQGLTEGMPNLDILIQEAINIGIPQDIVASLVEIGPSMGISPEELLIQAGSMFEQSLAQGIPQEEAVNSLRGMLQEFMSQAGNPMDAQLSQVANLPQEQMQGPMPAQMEGMIQGTGQEMLNQIPGVPMPQTPISNIASDPMMEQQLAQMGMAGPEEVQALDKSVLADIVASSTLKSEFIDFIPVLNEAISKISEMILKLEISKVKLSDEVGSSNVKTTLDKLRLILKELGKLVLEIVNFK